MTTRRQHYVWRKYLEPWTIEKGRERYLWCLRRDADAPLFTNSRNVAVERDFYRMRDVDETDHAFVRALAFASNTNPYLRHLNEGWIAIFETFLAVVKSARSHPNADLALRGELDKRMVEYQEDAYSRIETAAVGHLVALQAGDVRFFQDDDHAIQFSYFLAQQYFRTKAIRDRIRATFDGSDKERFERTWPILRYIFATNVGYSIFANRKAMPLQVVHAAPNMEFIAGDQPAINTYGAFVAPGTPIEELELYYPVSPTRAVIISGHPLYNSIHGKVLDPLRVTYLNQTIEFAAHEQVFSEADATLKAIQHDFCRRSK